MNGWVFVAEWEYFDLMCMVAVVCKAMVFAEWKLIKSVRYKNKYINSYCNMLHVWVNMWLVLDFLNGPM